MAVATAGLQKKWVGLKADLDKVSKIADALDIHPLVARVLVARGYDTPESADAFLNIDERALNDPFAILNMAAVCERIKQAIVKREKIKICGDYDVDGTCATSILVQTLQAMGADVSWRVPSRFDEGYGLHVHMVEQAKEEGVSLIITVDTGVTAFDAAKRAKEIDVDLIITDHHHIGETLPDALYVLHPAHPQGTYPFHNLCGAGVAFKLSQALTGAPLDSLQTQELLQLVAMATIQDQMPLVGENRVLVRKGIAAINDRPTVGVSMLIEATGSVTRTVNSTSIGFYIGPRINAAGRMATAGIVIELLLSNDIDQARALAKQLNDLNAERQAVQAQVEKEAMEQIDAHPEWIEQRSLVVSGEGWHEGVVGIVAGKIAERFYMPTLCVSLEHGNGKGSGRAGAVGYDLFGTVEPLRDFFERVGGHEAAIGFSLPAENIDELRERFGKEVTARWSDDIVPFVECDAEITYSDLTIDLTRDLKRLEPFGQANPEPVFFFRNAKVWNAKTMGANDKHLKFFVGDKDGELTEVVAFFHGHEIEDWNRPHHHHILVSVEENVWRDRVRVQMMLKDEK